MNLGTARFSGKIQDWILTSKYDFCVLLRNRLICKIIWIILRLSRSLALHVDFCRYAFKLSYDEAVLGEVTSEDKLAEYMTEYDRDWYLSTDTDHHWQLSIMKEKPSLLSLGRDKDKVAYFSLKMCNHLYIILFELNVSLQLMWT